MNYRVLVAQLGARRHYQQPILFKNWGILSKFYTDFYAYNNIFFKILRTKIIYNRLPKILQKSVDRYDLRLDDSSIIHFPKFSVQWTQSIKKTSSSERSAVKIWAYNRFCSKILQTNIEDINIIYGYNGASLELFKYAKSRGINCILDQTLADKNLLHQLLLEEEQIWQNWLIEPFTVNDHDLNLMTREHEEQKLADLIICGSNFVKQSLQQNQYLDKNDKILVAPIGQKQQIYFNDRAFLDRHPEKQLKELKILFAGSVNLRKGIPYLLKALKKIRKEIPFICKIAGTVEIKTERIKEYQDVCQFLNIVPRSKMNELYSWADIFVLPSICEGSAMAIYEALNYNLPVITTENAGSIVRDGIDGFIVPIRDSEAIANKLITHFNNPEYLLQNKQKERKEYMNSINEQSQENILYHIKKFSPVV